MGRRTAATGDSAPAGGLSSGMHPPFLFCLAKRETGRARSKEKSVGALRCSGPPRDGGRRIGASADLGWPSGTLGPSASLQLPSRGGWCGGQRGARTHLTNFSFRAFRSATRCPGSRGERPLYSFLWNCGTFPHQPFLRHYGDKVFNRSSPVTPSCASSLANGTRSSASPSTL